MKNSVIPDKPQRVYKVRIVKEDVELVNSIIDQLYPKKAEVTYSDRAGYIFSLTDTDLLNISLSIPNVIVAP